MKIKHIIIISCILQSCTVTYGDKSYEFGTELIQNTRNISNLDRAKEMNYKGGRKIIDEKDYDAGIKYFEKAIEIEPNYKRSYHLLLGAYSSLSVNDKKEIQPNYIKKIIEVVELILKKFPNDGDALYFGMSSYGAIEEYQKAIYYGEKLRALPRPDDGIFLKKDILYNALLYNLGVDYGAAGNYEKSLEYLKQYRDFSKTHECFAAENESADRLISLIENRIYKKNIVNEYNFLGSNTVVYFNYKFNEPSKPDKQTQEIIKKIKSNSLTNSDKKKIENNLEQDDKDLELAFAHENNLKTRELELKL